MLGVLGEMVTRFGLVKCALEWWQRVGGSKRFHKGAITRDVDRFETIQK